MVPCLAIAVACSGSPPDAAEHVCGDRIVGPEEACDDGNDWLADGCTPACETEPGPLEEEPNDAWDAANAWPDSPITGNLPEGDIDCVTFDVGGCEAVTASLVEPCPVGVVLGLYDAAGALVASGPTAADGCARIDPAVAPGARWLTGPTASVCVRSLLGTPVPGYTLDLSTGTSAGLEAGEDDLDVDGLPVRCDDDRDGDGVVDIDDNCVSIPNGPDDVGFAPNDEGFIQHWLALAPLTDVVSPDGCLPDPTERKGGDANLAPELGDADGDLTWAPYLVAEDRLNLRSSFGFVSAPREAYVHTYIVADQARQLTLAVGADDGVRAWLDGQVVLEVSSCQGTNRDEFQAPVSLVPGVNRLTLAVHDQGGGWGLFVRLLDAAGEPFTDYEVALAPDGGALPSQSDVDGDGVGDLCDPTPAG